MGAVPVDRAHLGVVVPAHRDRLGRVRARARDLAPDRLRRVGALAGAGRTTEGAPRRLPEARRSFGPVGGHPIHALPAGRATHRVRHHGPDQRRPSDLRGGVRLDHAPAGARSRAGARADRGIPRHRGHRPSVAARGLERKHRGGDGAARRRLLRRSDQRRRASDAAVRGAPRDGPRDRARRDLDLALRDRERSRLLVRVVILPFRRGARGHGDGGRVRPDGSTGRARGRPSLVRDLPDPGRRVDLGSRVPR